MDKLSWSPVLGDAGTNIKTRKLIEKKDSITIVSTGGSIFFSLIFIVLGAVALLFFFSTFFGFGGAMSREPMPSLFGFGEAVPLMVGSVFLIKGIDMLLKELRKLTFDLAIGIAYRPFGLSFFRKEVCCKIEDIQAIQLLMKEYECIDEVDRCYEINVVFKDGLRFNAWMSGISSSVRRDAMLLARFLDKPLLESEKCALLNN